MRHLRAGFDIGPDGVTLREAEAELPGDAALHLSGRLAGGRFTGAARLAAPDMSQTLAWLTPRAPAIVDALPVGRLGDGEPHRRRDGRCRPPWPSPRARAT